MASIKFHREFSNSKKNRSVDPKEDQIIAKELAYLKLTKYDGTNFFLIEMKEDVKEYVTANLFKNSQTAPTSLTSKTRTEDLLAKKTTGKEETLQEKLRKIGNKLINDRKIFFNSPSDFISLFNEIKQKLYSFLEEDQISLSVLMELTTSEKVIFDSKYKNIESITPDEKEETKKTLHNYLSSRRSISINKPFLVLAYEKFVGKPIQTFNDENFNNYFKEEKNVLLAHGFLKAIQENAEEKNIVVKNIKNDVAGFIKSFENIVEKFKNYHGSFTKNNEDFLSLLNNFEAPSSFDRDYTYFCISLIIDLYQFFKEFTCFVYFIKMGPKFMRIRKDNGESEKLVLANITNPAEKTGKEKIMEDILSLKPYMDVIAAECTNSSSSVSNVNKKFQDFIQMLDYSLPYKTLFDFMDLIEKFSPQTDFHSILSEFKDPTKSVSKRIMGFNKFFDMFHGIGSLVDKLKFNAEMIYRMNQSIPEKKLLPGPSERIDKPSQYEDFKNIFYRYIYGKQTKQEELENQLNAFFNYLKTSQNNNKWSETVLYSLKTEIEELNSFMDATSDEKIGSPKVNKEGVLVSKEINFNVVTKIFVQTKTKMETFFKFYDEQFDLRTKYFRSAYDSKNFDPFVDIYISTLTNKNVEGAKNDHKFQENKKYFSIIETIDEIKNFMGFKNKDFDIDLQRECLEKSYPFYDITGNPFQELPIIEQQKRLLEKQPEPPMELIPDLVRIHETIVYGNSDKQEFVQDLPDTYRYDYSIVLGKGYFSGAVSNEVEKYSKFTNSSKEVTSLGAFFKINSNGDIGEFYDTYDGKYGKIEVKESLSPRDKTKFRKKTDLPDLIYIPYFNFVSFIKQDKFYFETKIKRKYNEKDPVSVSLKKYKNSDFSVPSANNDIASILSHCYDYKERHRGRIYTVVYNTDINGLSFIAFDKKNVYKLEDYGRSYSSNDIMLDDYTTNSLLFCANITKMNISQEIKNSDGSRGKSLHSDNFYISVSVCKPGDVFYNKNRKYAYDVCIVASNIFPYLPIIGLHQKQITFLPEPTEGKNKLNQPMPVSRDPIWIITFKDIISGLNGTEVENKHYKYSTVEVHDTKYYKFHQNKRINYEENSSVQKTGAFLIYSTPREYVLDVLSMGGISLIEMANNLRSKNTKEITFNGYKAEIDSAAVISHIAEDYPINALILRTLCASKKGFAALVEDKKPDEIISACKKLAKLTAETIFAKMSTYSMGKYSLSTNVNEKVERFYDFAYAMNSKEITPTPFITSTYERKSYQGSSKTIALIANETKFEFFSPISAENPDKELILSLKIGTFSEETNRFTIYNTITHDIIEQSNNTKIIKKIEINFSDLQFYLPEIYEKYSKKIPLTRNDLSDEFKLTVNNKKLFDVSYDIPFAEIMLIGKDITYSREIVLTEKQKKRLEFITYFMQENRSFKPIDEIDNLLDSEDLLKGMTTFRDISNNSVLKNYLFYAVITGQYSNEYAQKPDGNDFYSETELINMYFELKSYQQKNYSSSFLKTNMGLEIIEQKQSILKIKDNLLFDSNKNPKIYTFNLPISILEVIAKEKVIKQEDPSNNPDYIYQIDITFLTFLEKILKLNNLIINLDIDYRESSNDKNRGIGISTGNYLRDAIIGFPFDKNNLAIASEFYGFYKMFGIDIVQDELKHKTVGKRRYFSSFRELPPDVLVQ